MAGLILPEFSLGLFGASLTYGRLEEWTQPFGQFLAQQPEALGPINIYNQAKGSQTSVWGLANIGLIATGRCSHVVIDDFSMNDSVDFGAGPAVTRANHITNLTNMVAAIRAARADTVIALMTMNPNSVEAATSHPALADYYNDTVALAATLVCDLIDNYNGTVTTPGGWIKPLPATLTHGAIPFATPVTATYGQLPAATTWNAAGAGADVTFSPDMLTGRNPVTGAAEGARATVAITGKKHFEMTVVEQSAGTPFFPALGITNATFTVTYPGIDANGIGVLTNGTVFRNGAVGVAGFTFGAGDVVGIEVDTAANLIYFLKGLVRSAGFDISGIAGARYPTWGGQGVASVLGHFTEDGDGIHPIYPGALDTYLMPNMIAWAREKMGDYWP